VVVRDITERRKFEKQLELVPGLMINSSMVNAIPERPDVKIVTIPATEAAKNVGNPKVANMVMLGAYITYTLFTYLKIDPFLTLPVSMVVLYLYNFKLLPLNRLPDNIIVFGLTKEGLQNAISFLNLALAGFVTAGVAVRFVFPSVSLEGKSFWILRSSPITMRRLLWSKFWMLVVASSIAYRYSLPGRTTGRTALPRGVCPSLEMTSSLRSCTASRWPQDTCC
jgi:hypothetical protein